MTNKLPKITNVTQLYITVLELNKTITILSETDHLDSLESYTSDILERIKEFSNNSAICPHCNSLVEKSYLSDHNETEK